MTRKLFPVLLCAVLAAAAAGCLNSGSGSEPVKLATYNIQIGRGMDRRYNIDRTVEALRRISAETIVLNEVDVGTKRSFGVDQASFLGGKLKMNSAFGRASDRPGGVYGNAVLSVYPIEKLAVLDLPATPRESRSALVVKICAPKPYYVIATHLSYEQKPEVEKQRLKSIDLIAGYVRQKKLSPVLLCGDLNSNFNSPVIRQVSKHGFRIVNSLTGDMLSCPAKKPTALLDYICVFPADAVQIIDCRVLDEPLASDHRPVRAELLFQSSSISLKQ